MKRQTAFGNLVATAEEAYVPAPVDDLVRGRSGDREEKGRKVGFHNKRFCDGGSLFDFPLLVPPAPVVPRHAFAHPRGEPAMGRCVFEQRPAQTAQDRFGGHAPALGAKGRHQRFEKSQAQVKVLELRPWQRGTQNASPPWATLRGRTSATTNRWTSLSALEKIACPTSRLRIKSGRSSSRLDSRTLEGLAFWSRPQTAAISSATL